MKLNSDKIMRYESGVMSAEEITQMFKYLYESGDVWNLPTQYLNVAGAMIEHGYFTTQQTTN